MEPVYIWLIAGFVLLSVEVVTGTFLFLALVLGWLLIFIVDGKASVSYIVTLSQVSAGSRNISLHSSTI